jgi:hypothetical protein
MLSFACANLRRQGKSCSAAKEASEKRDRQPVENSGRRVNYISRALRGCPNGSGRSTGGAHALTMNDEDGRNSSNLDES